MVANRLREFGTRCRTSLGRLWCGLGCGRSIHHLGGTKTEYRGLDREVDGDLDLRLDFRPRAIDLFPQQFIQAAVQRRPLFESSGRPYRDQLRRRDVLGHGSVERDHGCRLDDRFGRSRRFERSDSRAGTARWRRSDGAATQTPETRSKVQQHVLVRDEVLREVSRYVVAVHLDEGAHVAIAPERFGGRRATGQ